MQVVVLDSTVLLAAGPSSGPLRDLALCARLEEVQIHVPEMVIREVATNIAQKAAASTAGGLLALGQWSDDTEVQRAIDTLKALKARRDGLVNDIQDAVEGWVASVGGVVQPLHQMDTGPVFDDYFFGRGAFKDAAKERSRIPDAFIYHYVANLRESQLDPEDALCVVTSDKTLAENLAALPRVRVFSSVSSLLITGGIQNWTRIGGLRVHNDDLQRLVEDVAMQVVLPGEPVFVEPSGLDGVRVRLDEAAEKDGTVYFPFEIVFNEVTAVIDGAPNGEADTSVAVGPVKMTGMTRGKLHTDPDGNRFVVELRPTSVTTHAPPGFEGC